MSAVPIAVVHVPPDLPLVGLEQCLRAIDRLAVAVSGGVDSLTLATLAFRLIGARADMFHAVSPAVPHEATERVKAMARGQGWHLTMLDAGEFADADYRRNPVDRCFYCKTNLYGEIARRTATQIVSGANLDDLQDYRPGLDAAARHKVRHPYIEANFDKRMVRRLSRDLGLGEIAELPAAPCLSSRVETGIAIDPAALAAIHSVETLLRDRLRPETVRCRLRAASIVIELDPAALARLDESERSQLTAEIAALCRPAGDLRPVRFDTYRTGSAFLRSAR